MIPPQDRRRRDRARPGAGLGDLGVPTGGRDSGAGNSSDPLAVLRAALQTWDAEAFAGCFSAEGWIRVPRPEGDVVLRGRDEIARAGYELRAMLGQLSWTPSQRFLAAGQVVEEAVVHCRVLGDPADDQIRVSMRAVSTLDPVGWISSLTLWIDWAALNDPHGVQSARGAASALVAYARAQDSRGLRVIETDLTSLPLIGPMVPEPAQPPSRSVRPAASVLWWRRHRGTVAGSLMAVLAVGVIGWVAQNVLNSPGTRADTALTRAAGLASPDATGAGAGTAGSGTGAGGSGTGTGAGGSGTGNGGKVSASGLTGTDAAATGAPSPAASHVPVVVPTLPNVKPSVQSGEKHTFQSDLLFKTDSTDLSEQALSKLQDLAATIRSATVKGTVQVNGYTDNRGTNAYNRTLSMNRARAVADALSGYLAGAQVVEIEPQGFGESDPADTNDTAAGRQSNRRVVVVLPTPT